MSLWLLRGETCARLDVFVSARTELSREAAKALIKQGDITVNGRPRRPSDPVAEGDTVRVAVPPPRETAAAPEDIPLDIVYEDEDVAVVNKPVGMVVHPAAGNPAGTLVNGLLHALGGLSGIGGELRPGIVHRIDKDTSGLLVVAKNDAAHVALCRQIAAHTAARVYVALCAGNVKQDCGTVDKPIGRSPKDRKKMAVVQNGKSAVTHYAVLERFKDCTLVECRLETGRTHQIRVHMAALGHGILGDPLYGPARPTHGFSTQALHARQLSFTHPRTGQPMVFCAPPPQNFLHVLQALRSQTAKLEEQDG